MPDDHYNGPRINDRWPPADESPREDAWTRDDESPPGHDPWVSDLWASTSGNDAWAPSSGDSAADAPAGAPWVSDLWPPSSDSAGGEVWTSGAESPSADTSPGAAWVNDVWASTEPSPWVSDLWASTDPATSSAGDSWPSAADSTAVTERAAGLDAPPADEPSEADAPASEPFWRSESWLLEPASDDARSPGVAGDDDTVGAGISWPDTSTDPDRTQTDWDAPTALGGDAADQPADHSPAWSDLYEDSSDTWRAYQKDIDEPAPQATPAPAPLATPTNASEFAEQRSASALKEPPSRGMPGVLYKVSGGLIRLKPTKEERTYRECVIDIRRSIAGLRQITFTNPKGGSGKTTAALLTSMTLGQLRGGYVLAWDNNETQGTLGVRARRHDHSNTVRDLIADLPAFSGPVAGRVGDLAKYVRSQGDAMFDILASDEQAEAGEMMTAAAFQAVREVVGRFYKLILVDTGNNVRAANWAAAIDSTDQLVVTASVRWESAYSASRMLDYLEQSGRSDLVSNAVTVLTMPASMKGLNLSQVETHFSVRTREVLHVPFDPQLDNGDEIPFEKLNPATRRAWLQIAAAIVRGL